MTDIILAQLLKNMNSTAAIIKYSSAVAACSSTNTIEPTLIFSDKQNSIFLEIRIRDPELHFVSQHFLNNFQPKLFLSILDQKNLTPTCFWKMFL